MLKACLGCSFFLTRRSAWSLSLLSESSSQRLWFCNNNKLASQASKLWHWEWNAVPYLMCGVMRVRGNRSFLPTHTSRLWHSKLEVRMQVRRKCTWWTRFRARHMRHCRSCSSSRDWARHLEHIERDIKNRQRNNARRCPIRTDPRLLGTAHSEVMWWPKFSMLPSDIVRKMLSKSLRIRYDNMSLACTSKRILDGINNHVYYVAHSPFPSFRLKPSVQREQLAKYNFVMNILGSLDFFVCNFGRHIAFGRPALTHCHKFSHPMGQTRNTVSAVSV